MTVELVPIRGMPEVAEGDDLARLLLEATGRNGIRLEDGDVIALTQKVVSKAEGRVVSEEPDGKAAWVARQTRRVVARRGDLVVVETVHGFVCANAGVDASNVGEGMLSLLPDDPDASAERIRSALASATGVDVAVVITDTFGRPWRNGVVNVAIGCAGLPAVVDLRGTKDATGRVLEATIVALADEVAAASGLVMGKADGVPAALVRGVRSEGIPTPARALLRPPEEDLFRESPLQALHGLGQTTTFAPREVAGEIVTEALLAARAAPAPDGRTDHSWLLVGVVRSAARKALAASATDPEAARVVEAAPVAIVPVVRIDDAAGRATGLVGAGAATQNLFLALHSRGLVSGWLRPDRFDPVRARAALDVDAAWEPAAIVVAGWAAE